jgi:L-methionine (R)-S-oxide reductase
MKREEKEKVYQIALKEIEAVLDGEKLMLTKMATINCVLKNYLPYYFWVGFYCVHKGSLIVGPYQGTLGCINIPYSKGVCGRAARTGLTQIVEDVHEDPEHVACDSRSNSEIVVPVFNSNNQLIAVFDVDSTDKSSFDDIDKKYLENLLNTQFSTNPLEYNIIYSE